MQRPDCCWMEWKHMEQLGEYSKLAFVNQSRPLTRMKRKADSHKSMERDNVNWWVQQKSSGVAQRPWSPPPSFLALRSEDKEDTSRMKSKPVPQITEDEVEIGQLVDIVEKVPAWLDRDMKPWE